MLYEVITPRHKARDQADMQGERAMTEAPVQSGEDQTGRHPKRVFSGVQPTGNLHLGNFV